MVLNHFTWVYVAIIVTSPDRIPGAPNWSSRQHLSDTSIQQCSATLGTSVLPTKCGESGLSYTWQAAFHTNWTRHRGWDPCVLKGSRSKRTWYCSQDKRIFYMALFTSFQSRCSTLNSQRMLNCCDAVMVVQRTLRDTRLLFIHENRICWKPG